MKPLSKFPIITTNRVEKAEYWLSQSITDLQILRVDDRRRFKLEMNAVNFGWTSLVYNQFGVHTKLKTVRDMDSVLFVTGIGIPSKFSVDNEPYLVSPHEAVIIANAKEVQIERPRNSELLILRVALSDLWRHFENLTNKHHQGSLIFDRNVNVLKGFGAMLKGLKNHLADLLNYDGRLLINTSARKNFDDMLMTAFLSLPHNKRDALYDNHSNTIAPGFVRRAEEYMRAHLRNHVTIADLIRICDCSRSVLFSAFRSARGCTPMEFLAEQRLQNARKQLLKSNSDATIASIAIDCGFISHSWFSQVYRKRFGERPSDTMRKRR